jgi:DNA-binding transcriptional MerR regulator
MLQNAGQPKEKTTEESYLTIGALAKQCDVTVRTLRYYEEMDLIGPVKRSSGKYRLYNRQALKRVNAITALQGLNFSLDAILAVLGSYSQSKTFNKLEMVNKSRELLNSQHQLIDEKIAELALLNQDIEQRLQLLNSICTPCQTAVCPDSCLYLEVHS